MEAAVREMTRREEMRRGFFFRRENDKWGPQEQKGEIRTTRDGTRAQMRNYIIFNLIK